VVLFLCFQKKPAFMRGLRFA